eukprot:Partr_v1_DN28442_c2_g1_i2_m42231 putative Phosphatidylinositol glycan anchor biosynthesis, class L
MSWLVAVIFGLLMALLLWVVAYWSSGRVVFDQSSMTSGKPRLKLPVLFVTAHPDDESMFFAPTILSLVRQLDNSRVKRREDLQRRFEQISDEPAEELDALLAEWKECGYAGDDMFLACLSSGDADGLGQLRKRELMSACLSLGFREQHVFVADHPGLKDGMRNEWDEGLICTFLESYVREFGVQTIISFDDYGVSGHPNHRAIGRACRTFSHSIASSSTSSGDRSIDVYRLESLPIYRKFLGVLEAVLSALIFVSMRLNVFFPYTRYRGPKLKVDNDIPLQASDGARRRSQPASTIHLPENSQQRLLFVSTPFEFIQSCLAMSQHYSQLVWFRFLYILFSRYMYVNTLQKVT